MMKLVLSVCSVLSLTSTVASRTEVKGIKLSDLLITRKYNSTAKYKSDKKSDNNEETENKVTNGTDISGQNVTKLTFGEMVTIYHDIWNTMLIGK